MAGSPLVKSSPWWDPKHPMKGKGELVASFSLRALWVPRQGSLHYRALRLAGFRERRRGREILPTDSS
jgi:hypothetical protein